MWMYSIPSAGSDNESASREKCGYRREPGYRRMSASRSTPFSFSKEMKSERSRVECPMENRCFKDDTHTMTYYAEHAVELKRDLAAEIPTDELRELHRKRPLLHALIAIGNVAALLGSAVAIVHLDRWYLLLPFSFIARLTVFVFTVLLHEVVHRPILVESSDLIYRILGLAFAIP